VVQLEADAGPRRASGTELRARLGERAGRGRGARAGLAGTGDVGEHGRSGPGRGIAGQRFGHGGHRPGRAGLDGGGCSAARRRSAPAHRSRRRSGADRQPGGAGKSARWSSVPARRGGGTRRRLGALRAHLVDSGHYRWLPGRRAVEVGPDMSSTMSVPDTGRRSCSCVPVTPTPDWGGRSEPLSPRRRSGGVGCR